MPVLTLNDYMNNIHARFQIFRIILQFFYKIGCKPRIEGPVFHRHVRQMSHLYRASNVHSSIHNTHRQYNGLLPCYLSDTQFHIVDTNTLGTMASYLKHSRTKKLVPHHSSQFYESQTRP